jgi:hypothetical protein
MMRGKADQSQPSSSSASHPVLRGPRAEQRAHTLSVRFADASRQQVGANCQCAWQTRDARIHTEPYPLDALCLVHTQCFVDAILRITPFMLVVTTRDMLCVVTPSPQAPSPRDATASFMVLLASNEARTSASHPGHLAQFSFAKHALHPARLGALTPFLTALCKSCPSAQIQAVCDSAAPPAASATRLGPYLHPPARALDMSRNIIVRQQLEQQAADASVPATLGDHDAKPPLPGAVDCRFLEWAPELRVHVLAQTLSCVFMQTHMPDPRLPDAGVLSLYSWARRGGAGGAEDEVGELSSAGDNGGAALWVADLAKAAGSHLYTQADPASQD